MPVPLTASLQPPGLQPNGGAVHLTRTYKITLLIALYLAQGLPYGFFTLALPVLLRQAGFSLTAIGALSLLYLPWALKFMWAPFVDHLWSRRGWLLVLQSTSIAAALVLTQLDLTSWQTTLIVAAFGFSIIAATQDIVTDGVAVRMLDARERGLANGVQVGAYRVGMILGGGVLLLLFTRTSWSVVFACMAGLLALTSLPVFFLDEGARVSALRPGFAQLLVGWLTRLRSPGMLGFIALIFCYRYGDQMVTSLLNPFLADQGLTTGQIAMMKGALGSSASLVGAVLGGWLAFRAGRRTAILASGIAQALCFSLYIVAAFGAGGVNLLWVATVSEGVIGTMATVALFTLMMDASHPEHAGTDYTLLASSVVLVSNVGSISGGALADAIGYGPTFIIGAMLALAGCLWVVRSLDRNASPARVKEVWNRTTTKIMTNGNP